MDEERRLARRMCDREPGMWWCDHGHCERHDFQFAHTHTIVTQTVLGNSYRRECKDVRDETESASEYVGGVLALSIPKDRYLTIHAESISGSPTCVHNVTTRQVSRLPDSHLCACAAQRRSSINSATSDPCVANQGRPATPRSCASSCPYYVPSLGSTCAPPIPSPWSPRATRLNPLPVGLPCRCMARPWLLG